MSSKAMLLAVAALVVAFVAAAPFNYKEHSLKENEAHLIEGFDKVEAKFGPASGIPKAMQEGIPELKKLEKQKAEQEQEVEAMSTAGLGFKDLNGKPLIQNKNWQCPGTGSSCEGMNCMCQPGHPSCCRWTGQILKAVTCRVNTACKNVWKPKRKVNPPAAAKPGDPVTAPIGANPNTKAIEKDYVSLSNAYQL